MQCVILNKAITPFSGVFFLFLSYWIRIRTAISVKWVTRSVKLFWGCFSGAQCLWAGWALSHLLRLQKVPEASRCDRFAAAITGRSPQQDEYSGVCLTWHYLVMSVVALPFWLSLGLSCREENTKDTSRVPKWIICHINSSSGFAEGTEKPWNVYGKEWLLSNASAAPCTVKSIMVLDTFIVLNISVSHVGAGAVFWGFFSWGKKVCIWGPEKLHAPQILISLRNKNHIHTEKLFQCVSVTKKRNKMANSWSCPYWFLRQEQWQFLGIWRKVISDFCSCSKGV